MATKRYEPTSFPADMFARQYNMACQMDIHGFQVQVRALRSRKHATAEVSMRKCAGGPAPPIPDTIIAKYFENQDQHRLHHEQVVFSHAMRAGIPVPRILHVLENFLVLERVDGRTLMDVVNDMGVALAIKKEAVGRLGAWLNSFHDAFATHASVRRRGDANLRNFIITSTGCIFGLDFEEASSDAPDLDFHDVIDSILQSDPGIYTDGQPNIEWKYALCECLLRSYATAARKTPAEIIKDPAGFVAAQLVLMRQLATVRGTSSRLEPLLPAIKQRIEAVIDRVVSCDG